MVANKRLQQMVCDWSVAKQSLALKAWNRGVTFKGAVFPKWVYQLMLQPHIVHWGINSPQKHYLLFFAKTPLKSANCPSPVCFSQTPPKNWIFQWTSILKSSSLMPKGFHYWDGMGEGGEDSSTRQKSAHSPLPPRKIPSPVDSPPPNFYPPSKVNCLPLNNNFQVITQ